MVPDLPPNGRSATPDYIHVAMVLYREETYELRNAISLDYLLP